MNLRVHIYLSNVSFQRGNANREREKTANVLRRSIEIFRYRGDDSSTMQKATSSV